MEFLFLILAAVVSVATVIYGKYALKNGKKGNIKKAILTTAGAFALIMLGAIVSSITGGAVFAETATTTAGTATSGIGLGEGLKYLSAALSTGIATIATGKAVGTVGSSAIGAISEDSSLLGKTLIFVGMAEGIAIYGMIISILILFV